MENPEWIELFSLFPPIQHDKLMIQMTNGIEIAITSLLRLEGPYAVVRGRVAGTSDAGRVFFVPFDRISYLCFQKEVKEAAVLALFGQSPPAAPATPATPGADPAAEPAPTDGAAPPTPAETPPDPPPEPVPAAAAAEADKPPRPQTPELGVDRNQLLERIRARAANQRRPGGPR
jgi:hypothetical protein